MNSLNISVLKYYHSVHLPAIVFGSKHYINVNNQDYELVMDVRKSDSHVYISLNQHGHRIHIDEARELPMVFIVRGMIVDEVAKEINEYFEGLGK